LLIYIENLTLRFFFCSPFLYGRLADLFSSHLAIPNTISGPYLSFEVCVYVALGPALCHGAMDVCSRRNDTSSSVRFPESLRSCALVVVRLAKFGNLANVMLPHHNMSPTSSAISLVSVPSCQT
jgi:hypothetical protein